MQLDRALPLGPWQARVRVASGPVVHTSSATITFAPMGGAGSGSHTALLERVAALIATLAVLGALLMWRRPRRPVMVA